VNPKILSLDQLATRATELRAGGAKLIATNGCFDILHVGHVRYLQKARGFGDALAVGVNSDASVRAIKGNARPLNSETDRAEVLAALECVNFITIFSDVRATRFLQRAAPAIYVKGGDYTPSTLDAEERDALGRLGVEIRIIPFEIGYSTTALVEKMKST
jgi:rfaE bifunctional protein nucleotidyltransferase chain/domain